MTPRTKRVWKATAIVVAALALIYLGLTLWSFIALHRAYAALKRDGRPMTLAEILPPPLADADNAAPLFKQACQILSATRVPRTFPNGRHPSDSNETESLSTRLTREMNRLAGTNLTPTATAELREAITNPAVIQAFALMAEASRRKGCQTPGFWEKRDNEPFPFYELSLLTGLMCWRARIQALDGAADTAWHPLFESSNLVHSTASTPGVLGYYLTSAHESRLQYTFRCLCHLSVPSTNVLLQAIAQCKSLEHPDAHVLAWEGERIHVNEVFFGDKRYETFRPYRLFDRVYLSSWNPFLRLDQAAFLHGMRELVDPPCSTNEVVVPPYCRFAGVLVSGRYLYRQNLRLLASTRCTHVGLAVLLYRQQHGQWPEKLELAIQPVPADPFAEGQPLVYRQTTNGFVVASVGRVPKSRQIIAWEFEPRAP